MGKGKLQKFEEMKTFNNVFQPDFNKVLNNKNYYLKSNWNKEVFKNNHPLVLELGCGKGEYTLGLSRKFPDKNFIGIDIKGARIWKGAKEANLDQIKNVAFLRTRIEFINAFFGKNEVNEIWITFPDPQIKKRRNKKRLNETQSPGAKGFIHSRIQEIKPSGLRSKNLQTSGFEAL